PTVSLCELVENTLAPPSRQAVKHFFPSPLNSTPMTSLGWPINAKSLPVTASNKRKARSREPVATRRSSGEKTAVQVTAECQRLLMSAPERASQILTVPSSDVVANFDPSDEKVAE